MYYLQYCFSLLQMLMSVRIHNVVILQPFVLILMGVFAVYVLMDMRTFLESVLVHRDFFTFLLHIFKLIVQVKFFVVTNWCCKFMQTLYNTVSSYFSLIPHRNRWMSNYNMRIQWRMCGWGLQLYLWISEKYKSNMSRYLSLYKTTKWFYIWNYDQLSKRSYFSKTLDIKSSNPWFYSVRSLCGITVNEKCIWQSLDITPVEPFICTF